MVYYLFLPIFIFVLSVCESKLPEIKPRDVRLKVEEILKAHVTHKKLTPELLERAFKNFLEELDPAKTYFISGDIEKWTHPSRELLETSLRKFHEDDYAPFEEMHREMVEAIERRNGLEPEIAQASPVEAHSIDRDELNILAWTDSVPSLMERLLQIKAAQLDAVEKFEEESKEQFFQRIKKRRVNREQEIIGTSEEEKKRLILTYILKAVSSALDSHTNYFTPSEANQFMIQVQQKLCGIGAQLRDNLNGFSVVRLIEGGPASQNNKLKINDRIIAVNQQPVVGMDIIDAVDLIRGEKGTSVLLTVVRESGEGEEKEVEKLDIELTRGDVVLEESRLESSYEPYGDGVIAHLQLFSFYQDETSSSALDIQKALSELEKAHKLKGVVLDLRNNVGGLLNQAVEVVGLFITKGIVVSIKDNSGKVQHLRTTNGKTIWNGPFIVLTNRASASAAEIVAQTLKDYGRALVVGDDYTFGKGTFQTFTFDSLHSGRVNAKGEYKVTRGRYYTVSGESPQGIGVKSDIEVPGLLSQLEVGEKFGKYPLENDKIPPNFNDDLSDIPFLHRKQIQKQYRFSLQKKITSFTKYRDVLQKNSQARIEQNKNYQNFLTEIQKKRFDAESITLFGQSDLQLQETFNIMKDLIFLTQNANLIGS